MYTEMYAEKLESFIPVKHQALHGSPVLIMPDPFSDYV